MRAVATYKRRDKKKRTVEFTGDNCRLEMFAFLLFNQPLEILSLTWEPKENVQCP